MKALIEHVLAESGFRDNPYFTALQDGTFNRDDFLETQVQFYFAVVFFSRPMAAVAAKIPEAQRRVEVLRNVWEEHGEGDASLMHGATFLTFLERVGGLDETAVDTRALWPEVRVFNTTLVGAAVLDDYLVSVGMLGIIERMFSEISGWIGEAVVARGWLARDQLIHYTLHHQLDIKHAEDFFSVLAPVWESDPASRYAIEQGIRLGATVFDGLYRGLHRRRARRWMMSG